MSRRHHTAALNHLRHARPCPELRILRRKKTGKVLFFPSRSLPKEEEMGVDQIIEEGEKNDLSVKLIHAVLHCWAMNDSINLGHSLKIIKAVREMNSAQKDDFIRNAEMLRSWIDSKRARHRSRHYLTPLERDEINKKGAAASESLKLIRAEANDLFFGQNL